MARENQEDQDMATCGGAGEETDRLSPSSLKVYQAQYFDFTPKTSMMRVCTAFHDCLYNTLFQLENEYVRELSNGGSGGAEEQLRFSERSRVLQQFAEKQINQISEWITALVVRSGCFSAPPNMSLPDDQCHKEYPTDLQEILKLESSLADLVKAYHVEVHAEKALLAEEEEQSGVEKQLEGILEWVRDLQAAWVKESNSNFHESFQLVMESVKKLQEAVQESLVQSKAPH